MIPVSHRYYLAADGGGSKVQAVLYDEHFNILRTGHMSGTNVFFKPAEGVRAEMDQMLENLLCDISRLSSVDFCLVGSADYFQEALTRRCAVDAIHKYSEPCMGLAAAFTESGVLALSGTGSDAFVVKDGEILVSVGGWGPLFGDEGSGYDIGLRSIKAAIYAHDGRRPPTIMTDMIMERFQLTNLWDVIFRMNNNPNARHEIASVAALTSKAAALGDRVALDVYRHAAHEMALQAITAMGRVNGQWKGPVVTMGGAWKGSTVMWEAFAREVRTAYPKAEIIRPDYDPVVGCIILRARREGMTMDEIRQRLQGKFDVYSVNKGGSV